jgi:hypothetical protein
MQKVYTIGNAKLASQKFFELKHAISTIIQLKEKENNKTKKTG